MPERDEKSIDLGIYARAAERGISATEIVAALLAIVWVVAVVAYILRAPESTGTLGLVMTLLVMFLPLALIWAAATTLNSVKILRDEAARLQVSVDAMRNAYIANQQTNAAGLKPSVEKKLDELALAAKQTETTLARFTTRRDSGLSVPSADRKAALVAPLPASAADEQPALALGTPAEALRPPLSVSDFVKALQFPENPDDREGFRALRLALDDREVAKLIRAAQDVLTLLSQEGIYMDDLRPDRARPEVWRRFAAGERGPGVSSVGGVRDRSSLALTAGRMREDPVFRDAGHHFLRTFDRTLHAFEQNATDSELAELADTRTARAFMLFGRVMGVFD